MPGLYTTGFQENGVDIGISSVEKSYLMDMYPSLVDWQKAPGLWCWGYNNNGQLGDNTISHKSSPVQTIAGGANWKSLNIISGGDYHTAAIKTDGTLWVWGENDYGKLGDNSTTKKSSPVQTVAGGTNWTSIACGRVHTTGIKTDGTLWLWGHNYYGQLGDNTRTSRSSPVQTIMSGTTWKQVACGYRHTTAIKTDGTLWSFGQNGQGQLGDNTLANKSSPVQTVAGGSNWKQVACGRVHVIAIKTDGTLWGWGPNTSGQLGTNTLTSNSSPVQSIATSTNWKQVAAGGAHSAAIKTDGTLWMYGYNGYGQLGTGTTGTNSSPVQTVTGGTNWKQVTCGYYHTAAVKTDGTLWVWGRNNYGQLGNNTVTNVSSPIQTITGGANWKTVAAIRYSISAIKESDDF